MGKGEKNSNKKKTPTDKRVDEATEGGLLVDPARVRFQHSRIRPFFSGCGRSVTETLDSIRRNEMSPSDLPPIQVRRWLYTQQGELSSPCWCRPISVHIGGNTPLFCSSLIRFFGILCVGYCGPDHGGWTQLFLVKQSPPMGSKTVQRRRVAGRKSSVCACEATEKYCRGWAVFH
jgi:hypothetical protein